MNRMDVRHTYKMYSTQLPNENIHIEGKTETETEKLAMKHEKDIRIS